MAWAGDVGGGGADLGDAVRRLYGVCSISSYRRIKAHEVHGKRSLILLSHGLRTRYFAYPGFTFFRKSKP